MRACIVHMHVRLWDNMFENSISLKIILCSYQGRVALVSLRFEFYYTIHAQVFEYIHYGVEILCKDVK